MPDLIAQGADYRKRWRRPLPADQAIELGRGDQAWGVNWDTRISRQHATLHWKEDRLLVEIIPGASNPIFYQGVEEDRFEIQLGEHFVIGETTFAVADSHLEATFQEIEPAVERIFSATLNSHASRQGWLMSTRSTCCWKTPPASLGSSYSCSASRPTTPSKTAG